METLTNAYAIRSAAKNNCIAESKSWQ